jgi:hypothetical protein
MDVSSRNRKLTLYHSAAPLGLSMCLHRKPRCIFSAFSLGCAPLKSERQGLSRFLSTIKAEPPRATNFCTCSKNKKLTASNARQIEVKDDEMPHLTEAEKKARGTNQKCRAVTPRNLEIIRAELAGTQQALDDVRYVLSLTVREIRKHGLMVRATVLDSHGAPVKTKKVNPALKVQKDAMSSLRTLKRMVVLLREEEALAAAKENAASEFEEFEPLVLR